jgi:hypothetical protein
VIGQLLLAASLLGDVVHDEDAGHEAALVVIDRRGAAADDQPAPVGEDVVVLLVDDALPRRDRADERPLGHRVRPAVRMEDLEVVDQLRRHLPAELPFGHVESPGVGVNDPPGRGVDDDDGGGHLPEHVLQTEVRPLAHGYPL